jgi:hypothetical protein
MFIISKLGIVIVKVPLIDISLPIISYQKTSSLLSLTALH